MDEIINKVAKSSLITIDLAHIFNSEISPKIKILDIQEFLRDGQILIEKEFRGALKDIDWTKFQDSYVHITCSGDPILPGWAFLLLQCHLAPFGEFCGVGNKDEFNNLAIQHYVKNMNLDDFSRKPIIIKGCGNMKIYEQTYISLIAKLYPVAKSLMYGEACSTVPLYKKK
ncbi:DUF2480 family protein [Ornithobacterium rhinotracheale]|uniref:DUF2480 family protein n=1 Tax=Ornithobacterium rhinotracheale TaxID=28251 RepID=UPI0016263B36|nr:DUF2480 family protein [Ornithobacterium rhinotracheale]UOH78051.1 DUF2480 family protein [Ornithobacterium rhinotracheale]